MEKLYLLAMRTVSILADKNLWQILLMEFVQAVRKFRI